jgi:hypothetical protein
MKVAKVRCSDNNGDDQQGSAFVVLKVFVHVDPSFSLDPYRNQVLRVRDSLGSALNCSPFKKIIVCLFSGCYTISGSTIFLDYG